MIKYLDKIKVKLLVKLIWGFSREKVASAIGNFSNTEADTVWQLVDGIEKVTDPHHRLEIFYQILEEDHHAEEFRRLYKQYSSKMMPTYNHERVALYNDDDEAWKLYAYCYVGEDEATERFKNILNSTDEVPLKNVLTSIIQDEMGHVQKAYRLLQSMGVSRFLIVKEVVKIKLKRRWEGGVRVAKMLTDFLAGTLLNILYYFVGPLYVRLAGNKLSPKLEEAKLCDLCEEN